MKILVTGTAGFIGFNLASRLLREGDEICGVDNFNDYYDVSLKEARNRQLEKNAAFRVRRVDLADMEALKKVFGEFEPDVVVNLAAQAGVRYSIDHPEVYMESNMVGFLNILECCRHAKKMPRLLYASSSSVYGGIKEMPFREDMCVDTPISLYAASKKSNELMAHCYTHLYGMQTIGFRFFTVYGPWGRPDMAAWLFADAMAEGRAIKVFNYGNMYRDFTYIDDIVDGLVRCIRSTTLPAYDVFNIGNHRSERLLDMIEIIAHEMGIASLDDVKMEMLPMQDGDVPKSFASVEKLNKAVGYEPTTPISVGMPKFVAWYKDWKAGKFTV
ncbi:MAG: GDP-mannose 4,6-dehydratase [Kiritimatiellae bacterium]|nr:GDP-mannose 4,6-dehydratase [Kiritimatiellia bacterium]